MNNLFTLQKYKLIGIIGSFQGKKRNKSFIAGLIIFLSLIIINFAVYTNIALMMFRGLGEMGLDNLCLFHGIITTFSVLIIIGIMRVSANSKTNDAELLLSLPIKKRDIIISKTLNTYAFDLCFSLLLFAPFFVIFLTKHFSVSTLITGLLFMFFVPLLSVGITYISSFLISRVFNKSKFGNFLKSIISVFIYIIVIAMLMIKTSTYGLVKAESMQQFFNDRPISNMFLNMMINTNLTNCILSFVIFVAPFIIGISLYYVNFGKSFDKYRNKNKELIFKNNSPSLILYKKEISNYFSTPAYVINTIIGPIMIVVFSVLAVIYKNDLTTLMGFTTKQIAYIFALASSLFLSTAIISGCSISLEGKSLWLIKSSPINEKNLFLSKIFCHLSITEPAVILSSIIMLFCGISFADFLIILFVPTLINFVIALSGLFINLCFPKFEFDNEIKVIKQSLATLLCMFFGFALIAFPLILYFAFVAMTLETILLISIAFYLVLIIIFAILDFTVGVNLLRKNRE